MAGEVAKVTAIEADITYDEMAARVTAIQAGFTYSEMIGRVTALGKVIATHTVDGTALTDPGTRVHAIQANMTRTIHHEQRYTARDLATELRYQRPLGVELRYSAPLDTTTLPPVPSPPRGGKTPHQEE